MKPSPHHPARSSKPKRNNALRAKDAAIRRRVRDAAEAAVSKKALDAVILDLRQIADFADYFLICHGGNARQMEAIAEAVEERLRSDFALRPVHRDGGPGGEWLVLDYLDFIVHVFSPASRSFYDLERLWSKAPRVALTVARRES